MHLGPRLQIVRAGIVLVCILTLSVLLQMLLVSPLQQRAAQQQLYDRFRGELARGVAPLRGADLEGRLGDPVAYLEIPEIGMRQVVVEGTTAATLYEGPGHRRDTVLPGQRGTSVVMGRRAAYGGPFADISGLKRGTKIHVTTGEGAFDFRVVGTRRSGDAAPPRPRDGISRLVLMTADGAPFVPSGLIIVDADSIVPAVAAQPVSVSSSNLPSAERVMGVDLSTLWRLVLWLQVLIAVVVGAVWSWYRWHRAKTWIVLLPPMLLVGLFTAGETARLLPNLL